jgi:hypothetical protein
VKILSRNRPTLSSWSGQLMAGSGSGSMRFDEFGE